jgi:hypothetical protein
MNSSSPDISDSDSNARDWLSLIRAPGLGPATLKPFFDGSSSISELLSQLRKSSDTRVKKHSMASMRRKLSLMRIGLIQAKISSFTIFRHNTPHFCANCPMRQLPSLRVAIPNF